MYGYGLECALGGPLRLGLPTMVGKKAGRGSGGRAPSGVRGRARGYGGEAPEFGGPGDFPRENFEILLCRR